MATTMTGKARRRSAGGHRREVEHTESELWIATWRARVGGQLVEPRTDAPRRRARMLLPGKRGRAGRVRCRHRRAGLAHVAATQLGRQHVDAGRRELDVRIEVR